MAIKTSTFSGWRLSGKDANAFVEQVDNPAPNPAAKAAVARGRSLAEEYQEKGYAAFSVKRKSIKKANA